MTLRSRMMILAMETTTSSSKSEFMGSLSKRGCRATDSLACFRGSLLDEMEQACYHRLIKKQGAYLCFRALRRTPLIF